MRSDLTATAVSSSRIDISWTDHATDENAYVVERSPDGSTGWTQLTSSLPADSTSYSDTGLSGSTTYFYRVKATNATGDSGYSNTASATTKATPPGPSPTLNTTPDDVWMTNGIVYSVVRSGDYIYVGGKFTRVRQSPMGKSFAATNLARFRADTGVGDPSWTPDVTGADMTKVTVYEVAAADGKIWVGGRFDAVDGVARSNLAAVSPDTGVVDPAIDPVVGTDTSVVHTGQRSGENRLRTVHLYSLMRCPPRSRAALRPSPGTIRHPTILRRDDIDHLLQHPVGTRPRPPWAPALSRSSWHLTRPRG